MALGIWKRAAIERCGAVPFLCPAHSWHGICHARRLWAGLVGVSDGA